MRCHRRLASLLDEADRNDVVLTGEDICDLMAALVEQDEDDTVALVTGISSERLGRMTTSARREAISKALRADPGRGRKVARELRRASSQSRDQKARKLATDSARALDREAERGDGRDPGSDEDTDKDQVLSLLDQLAKRLSVRRNTGRGLRRPGPSQERGR